MVSFLEQHVGLLRFCCFLSKILSYNRSEITHIFHTVYAEFGLLIFPCSLTSHNACAIKIAKRLMGDYTSSNSLFYLRNNSTQIVFSRVIYPLLWEPMNENSFFHCLKGFYFCSQFHLYYFTNACP